MPNETTVRRTTRSQARIEAALVAAEAYADAHRDEDGGTNAEGGMLLHLVSIIADLTGESTEESPWRRAQTGEYWHLEPFYAVFAVVGSNPTGRFTRADVFGTVHNIDLDDPRISSATRVWPVVGSD